MPTYDSLISTARNAVNDKVTAINRVSRELEEMRAQSAPDPNRLAELRSQKAEAEATLPRLEREVHRLEEGQADDDQLTRDAQQSFHNAERQAPGIYAQERSRVYTERDSGEFLRDLFSYSFGSLNRDARERLERHENEARAAGQISERAGTTGGFGGAVPPQYLIDLFASVARAGRPTANTAQRLQLPADGMSLIIPRGTSGTTTAVQATQNSAVSNTDIVEADLTVPVVTIAGQQDVSRQSLERATGIDQILFGDLALDYALRLNQQVLSGTGASNQALGILNTAGVNQAALFGVAVTLPLFYSRLAGQLNAVLTGRLLAPDMIIMHPRRWSWLLAQLDTTNRPLVTPNANGPTNSYAVSNVPVDTPSGSSVGSILGLPVVLDASIPTNVGTPLNDQVIIARDDDWLLWEDGDGAPTELRFEQTLAGQLTVKLVAYGYAAFTAARYPLATGIVGGNDTGAGFGLIAPTF